MQTPATTSFADVAGLQQLRQQAARQDPEALAEAAVQFEALVIGMMLKSAREATGEGVFDGPTTTQYLEMLDQQVALEMARKGGFGLADWLGAGLASTKAGDASGGAVNASPERMPLAAIGRPAAAVAAVRERGPMPPHEFVREILPHARDAARHLGIETEVLIAQAALESGWGRAMPTFPDGRPSFNYFGIKADADWAGERLARPTLEFEDGVAQRRWQQFRAYPDAAAGFADYVQFVQQSPRYRDALSGIAKPADYVERMAESGYATDPAYASKWLRVLDSNVLKDALSRQDIGASDSFVANMEVGAAGR